MSMSRGHGIDLHCLSPAASPASSLDFLSLSLSVPQIHQPLLYSGPLDPSFHCLETPLCLLLTDSYSQVTCETWVCQAGLLLHEMRPPHFPIPSPDSLVSAPFLSSSSFSLEEQQLCLFHWSQHLTENLVHRRAQLVQLDFESAQAVGE